MITLIIILLFLTILYYYSTRTFKYWEKRGIKHDKPVPLLGNNIRHHLSLKSASQLAEEAYFKYPEEKLVGFFRGTSPELVVRDPEIVKRILTRDFSCFHSRGIYVHKGEINPLMHNIIFTDGDVWKLLRKRVSPAFTSRKLKTMIPQIVECAESLKSRIIKAVVDTCTLDARTMMERYSLDIIGACGFGLDQNYLHEENSKFRTLGEKLLAVNLRVTIIRSLQRILPKLCKSIVVRSYSQQELTAYVRELINSRNGQTSNRGDFLDTLLDIQSKRKLIGESVESGKKDGAPEEASLEFDESFILGQVFMYFIAGFETISVATSFTLHQLAFNPEVQIKAQEEVDRVLLKYDNKLCYEAIKEMTYLEMVFKEELRIFPSIGFVMRESACPYTFPDLNVTIDKGVKVIIPIQAMHKDPKYFENPDEFRPERFTPEEYNTNNKYVYLPFGEGPRTCIGAQWAMMQSLAGLAAVLSCMTVQPAQQTLRKPIVNPKPNLVQRIKGGLPLMFVPRS